jgi:FkbM family methyltransferase
VEFTRREPLHATKGARAWIDRAQRGAASLLRVGPVRSAARRIAKLLRVPPSILQRLPVEGDFVVRTGGRQIRYRSSLYDAVGRKLFWGREGDYEPETVRAIVERLRGGVFLDVGANTGFFSLVAAGADPRVICHAFEPAPNVFAALQQNVRANGLEQQIVCRRSAVSDASGTTRLHLPDRNWSSATLDERGFRGAPGHIEEVTTVSLDDYAATHGLISVDVIKIDVEGFEHLVLRGARELLRRQRPAVVCECLPESRMEEIERLLRELEYTAFRLSSEGAVRATAMEADPSGESRNFLFIAAESSRRAG